MIFFPLINPSARPSSICSQCSYRELMAYTDSQYPIYPRIRYVVYGPDCPSRGLPMLECAGRSHFIADFERRLLRSIEPIDWRVVISGEIRVVTVGLTRHFHDEQSRQLARRNIGWCLFCCLGQRGG